MIINIVGFLITISFALCLGGLFIILPLGLLFLFVMSVGGDIFHALIGK